MIYLYNFNLQINLPWVYYPGDPVGTTRRLRHNKPSSGQPEQYPRVHVKILVLPKVQFQCRSESNDIKTVSVRQKYNTEKEHNISIVPLFINNQII